MKVYETRARRSVWQQWWVIVIFLFIFVAIGIGAYLLRPTTTASTKTAQSTTPTPKPMSLVSKTAFFGTTYWGRYINDWSMKSSEQFAYPFSRLNEFNRPSYDAWIAGLECPTVPGVNLNSTEEDTTLSFNCRPEYLTEAAKWFTAFTLANNHTDNQGADGFATTRLELDKVGIQYFGHYDPRVVDQLCEVVSLPARVTMSDGKIQKVKLPVALCGYHGVFRIPSSEAVAEIVKYKDIMPVIAMPHTGAEYKAEPDEIKTTLYRQMIDAGADMVLGDHPHWTQTTEAYQGKLIVYSMGNFIFDQQDTSEVTRSAGIGVTFSVEKPDSDQLQRWIALGESCVNFQDDCLARATQAGLKKLPFKYDIDIIATNDQGKITHPATDEQRASLLQRLKWSQTITDLSPPQYGH